MPGARVPHGARCSSGSGEPGSRHFRGFGPAGSVRSSQSGPCVRGRTCGVLLYLAARIRASPLGCCGPGPVSGVRLRPRGEGPALGSVCGSAALSCGATWQGQHGRPSQGAWAEGPCTVAGRAGGPDTVGPHREPLLTLLGPRRQPQASAGLPRAWTPGLRPSPACSLEPGPWGHRWAVSGMARVCVSGDPWAASCPGSGAQRGQGRAGQGAAHPQAGPVGPRRGRHGRAWTAAEGPEWSGLLKPSPDP